MQLHANVNLVLSREGKIIHREGGHNRVVAAGEALACSLMDPEQSVDPPAYIAAGSSNEPVTAADTGLGNEHSDSRTLYDISVVTRVSQLNLTFNIVATATWEVNELGIFNDATAGTMLCRFLTQGFTMTLNDELAVAWSLLFKGWDDLI